MKFSSLLELALGVALVVSVDSAPHHRKARVADGFSNSTDQSSPKPFGSSDSSKTSTPNEARTLYDLNSIIDGFRGTSGARAGVGASAMGGVISDLLAIDKPKGSEDHSNETVPSQVQENNGFGLMNIMRSLAPSTNKGDTNSSLAIGGFDMMHLMKGIGMGSLSFPALLAVFGIQRDQNAPGGSAPDGGSYDLTKLVAALNEIGGQSPGEGTNLGFLGGGLGLLVGSPQVGSGGPSKGLGAILGGLLGGG